MAATQKLITIFTLWIKSSTPILTDFNASKAKSVLFSPILRKQNKTKQQKTGEKKNQSTITNSNEILAQEEHDIK